MYKDRSGCTAQPKTAAIFTVVVFFLRGGKMTYDWAFGPYVDCLGFLGIYMEPSGP